ncbi:MAG TPA: type II secretion system minor pseudopilin GspH [Rhodanobacteraceae bacterium]|nr:type II secretion system minor pseudopilin GspH [Rhodanobacteraceae bacterium]
MSAARGFTLLEVLVAVVIVAVLAGAVGVGMAGLGGSRQLHNEAERLQHHLEYACETAQLDGHALGLRLRPDGYLFVRRDGDRWRALVEQPAMAAHSLPAGTQLVVSRDGERLAVPAAGASSAAPQLVCFSSGDLTPFRAELTRSGAGERFTLVGHADGRLTLESADDPR